MTFFMNLRKNEALSETPILPVRLIIAVAFWVCLPSLLLDLNSHGLTREKVLIILRKNLIALFFLKIGRICSLVLVQKIVASSVRILGRISLCLTISSGLKRSPPLNHSSSKTSGYWRKTSWKMPRNLGNKLSTIPASQIS